MLTEKNTPSGGEQDPTLTLSGFTLANRVGFQFMIDRVGGLGDRSPFIGIDPHPNLCKLVNRLVKPPHSKHHSPSRWAKTSAVEYVLPFDAIRRSHSSLLICGSVSA